MATTTIFVKNMVCSRCIMVVQNILNDLGLSNNNIQLGEIQLENPLSEKDKPLLEKALIKVGFEIIDDKKVE